MLKFFIFIFCLGLFPFPVMGAEDDFSPYIERHDSGWIDWDNGLIYGIGHGYLYLNRNSKMHARRTASLLAYSNIVKLAADLNIDDRNVLKSLDNGNFTIKLKAFVKADDFSSKFFEKTNKPYFEVIKVASLKGVKGLSAMVLDHLRSSKWHDLPLKSGGGPVVDQDGSWLVIDARKLAPDSRVSPALFPKIISNSGEEIYSLDKVEEEALVERGMARYVVSGASLPLKRSVTTFGNVLFNRFSSLFLIVDATAAEGKRRKRGRYIVKEVANVQGLAKTNLIISDTDARQLKVEDASSKILKQCRVVVVVSGPVGGIEGRLRRFFAFRKPQDWPNFGFVNN